LKPALSILSASALAALMACFLAASSALNTQSRHVAFLVCTCCS
jgi:hypothetical protein